MIPQQKIMLFFQKHDSSKWKTAAIANGVANEAAIVIYES